MHSNDQGEPRMIRKVAHQLEISNISTQVGWISHKSGFWWNYESISLLLLQRKSWCSSFKTTFLALFLTNKSSVFINYKDKTQIHWFQDSWVAQLRRLRPNLFPSSIWKDFDLCRFRSLINTRKARAASFAAAFLAAERLSWLKVLEKIQERKHFSEWSRFKKCLQGAKNRFIASLPKSWESGNL